MSQLGKLTRHLQRHQVRCLHAKMNNANNEVTGSNKVPHIIHVSLIVGAFGFNFTIEEINCKLASNSSRDDLCLTRDFDTFCYASLSFLFLVSFLHVP